MKSVKPPHFDVSQIPEVDRRALGATFYAAIKKFYADPANLARFEEWKARRLAEEQERMTEDDFS